MSQLLRAGIIVLFCAICTLPTGRLMAFHIAGAEITYTCDASNNYRFRLRLFRDCALDGQQNVADYDDVIYLHIFNSNDGTLRQIVTISAPPNPISVNPEAVEECGLQPTQVCREDGTYISAPINLPPRVGGYDVAWARCCRNSAVNNLFNSNQQGITYYTHVPGSDVLPSGCNNSATWDEQPPLFICLNKPVTFSQSATDIDGDELRYQIVNPLDSRNFQGLGAFQQDPVIRPPGAAGPGDPGNPFGGPPFTNVTFNAGFTFQTPLGPGSSASIDPNTGDLSFFPTNPGLFVVAYSVREFRNGVLIGETVRDIQFLVSPCADIPDLPIITPNLSAVDNNPEATVSANRDTIIANANNAFCFTFEIEDPDNTDPLNISVTPPPGPSVTIDDSQEPIRYTFCWTPACNTPESQIFAFPIEASDPDDCPNYNVVYDTIWVRVQQPPNNLAFVTTDLSGNPVVSGDTIKVILDEDIACFDFNVTSPLTEVDDIAYNVIESVPTTTPPVVSNVVSDGDNISGQICWPAGCEGVEEPYQLIIEGIKLNGCPPDNRAFDTVNIVVTPPENPVPEVTASYTSTVQPVTNDTVRVDFFELSNQALCIDFELRDSIENSRLRIPPFARVLNLTTGQLITGGNRTLTNPPIDNSTTDEFVFNGTFCWEVPCLDSFEDTLAVVFQLNDSSKCAVQHIVYDTTYVLLNEPFNPAPVVVRDDNTLPLNNDTLIVFADSSMQYGYTISDQLPAGRLSAAIRIETLDGSPYTGPPITLDSLSNNDPLSLTTFIDYTAGCENLGDTLLLIHSTLDSILCVESHRLEDTLIVIVQEPENLPPTLNITDSAGLPIIAPAITIAETDYCVVFELTDVPQDAQFGFNLNMSYRITDTQGNPLNVNGYFPFKLEDKTSITGRFCVNSECENLDDTLVVTLTGTDSSTCTLAHTVEESFEVVIAPKPPAPSVLDTLHNLPMRRDTIILQPRREQCIGIDFQDLLNNGSVLLSLDGQVFDSEGTLPSLRTVTGQGRVLTDLCWAPGCDRVEEGVYAINIQAFSQAFCIEPVQKDTTIYISVEEPENNPPVISVEGLPESITAGDSTCFTITVTDPDDWAILSLDGLTEFFDPNFGFGGNVRPTSIDTISNTEVRFNYCINPNCYQRRETYELRFRAADSTNCDVTLTTEETYFLPVNECGLLFVNVFTPNGDGINDTFGPIELEGIADYKMVVYDRSGRIAFTTPRGQAWNGNMPSGEPAPEGVYFFMVDWDLESGTGPLLIGDRTGHVTLLR